MNIENISRGFGIRGEIVACDVIKSGHINNTFKVSFLDGDDENCYIIQQINTYVFKEPVQMMENISRVTTHISDKLGESRDRMVLEFLKTKNGNGCFFDDEGRCWRSYRFIDNSVTYDTCNDLEVLRQAGLAFGNFQKMLGDFDASVLFETIPEFHNTEKRLNTLFAHVDEDPLGRVADAEAEIAFFRKTFDRAVKLVRLQKSGEVPLRVTHNDTKCNNVLFDVDTKCALAVIDLDTVMPGLAMHDFGDAVRFSTNAAAEDEVDVSKVALDVDKFRAFTSGYLASSIDVLTEIERETLVDGAIVMTIECAARFLDDYIVGDKYFKTDYPGHNLVRARAQVALARDIIDKYQCLTGIVEELAGTI